MRKENIIKLVNCGILNMTAHDLNPAHSYKAFKLKKEVEKAYKAIGEEHKSILVEQGVTEQMESEVKELLDKVKLSPKEPLTDKEKELLTTYNRLQDKARKVIAEANKEEVPLDIKTIPYKDWRELQKENRAKKINDYEFDILGGEAEIILEGIFWAEPQDEETEKKDN